MPYMTEALAVINELPRPPQNTRPGVVSTYAYQCAQQIRTDYKDDDETATTQAWMFAVGGTNANPSVFTIGAGLTLSVNTSGATAIVGTNPASTTIASITTRGGLRRAAAVFGITLTFPPG